jgi:hypothetical protein
MGLGGILQELKTEGVLALYHDYRSGRLVDYSGNGNNGVAAAPAPLMFFNKEGVVVKTGALIVVAASASWRWSTAFTMVFGYGLDSKLPSYTFADYVVYSTGPIGALRFGTSIGWSDGINLYIGGGDPSNYKQFGLSCSNGVAGKVYNNGIYNADLSGASVITAPVSDLWIIYPQIDRFAGFGRYFVLFKRVLTATEHARVYGQLENMTWNTKGLTPGPMMP